MSYSSLNKKSKIMHGIIVLYYKIMHGIIVLYYTIMHGIIVLYYNKKRKMVY